MDDREPSAAQAADDQLAKKLIRYAISCEFSRTPIRRDGIKERGELQFRFDIPAATKERGG